MKKKRKFPADVARFFHPEKSFNPQSSGIHQREKAKERSCIPIYAGYWSGKENDGQGR